MRWPDLPLVLSSLASVLRVLAMSDGADRTPEERLLSRLFHGYDSDARATIDVGQTVTVHINLLLLRIQKLDERSQILATTGLLLADWRDERLRWNSSLYGNLSDIVIRASRIWLPELAIINGADEMIQEFEKIRVLVSHDGSVHWEPGGVFTTTCDIDISYFPFDSQKCTIEVGAWAYQSTRMNLTNGSGSIETDQFMLNGEWDLAGTTALWQQISLPSAPNKFYSKVVFILHINRRYTFYLINIILPCILLSALILVVFCVPPEAGEKISSGISVLLAFTVFLLMLADNVPRTSLDTPILVVYLACTMGLGTVSVCLSVLTLNCHFADSRIRVPPFVRRVFLSHVARFFCLPPIAEPGMGQHPTEDIQSAATRHATNLEFPECFMLTESLSYHQIEASSAGPFDRKDDDVVRAEWVLLARLLDRVFFVTVLLAMLLSGCLTLLRPWF